MDAFLPSILHTDAPGTPYTSCSDIRTLLKSLIELLVFCSKTPDAGTIINVARGSGGLNKIKQSFRVHSYGNLGIITHQEYGEFC